MNRRHLMLCLGAVVGLPLTGVAAEELDATPQVARELGPTPQPNLPTYDGPIEDLWKRPWRLERKLVSFDGVIRDKRVASEGTGFPVGVDQIPYRSLVLLGEPDSVRSIVVATNDSLRSLKGIHTARVIGIYAGEQDYDPIIVAASIGPVPFGAPAASPTMES